MDVSRKKKPEVVHRRQDLAARARRIIGWVEEDGGFTLPCGHFVGARAQDLRSMVKSAGPGVIIEVVEALEADHEGCR